MAFGDKKREQQLTDSMSAAITDGIAEAMRPVFEELTGQMKNMMEKLQDQQAESMKIMADAFLEEMKNAANGMFADIASELDNVGRQQEAATRNMNEVADKLVAESKSMTDAADKLSGAVNDIREVQASIAKLVNEQNKAVDTFVLHIDKYSKSTEDIAHTLEDRQNEWITNYKTCDERLADTAGRVADTITGSVATLERSIAAFEQNIAGLKEACATLDNSTKTYADTVTRESEAYGNKLNKGIESTFEAFDNEMAGIVKSLGDAATQISEVTAQIPRTLKGSIDELERTIKR